MQRLHQPTLIFGREVGDVLVEASPQPRAIADGKPVSSIEGNTAKRGDVLGSNFAVDAADPNEAR
jgi:hypothetical protein